jgi:hypothetical protein
MCDCDCSSCIHSTYTNFIELCRKFVGRSTAKNLAIGLSDGSGERIAWKRTEQEEGMLPFMQFLLFTESCRNI